MRSSSGIRALRLWQLGMLLAFFVFWHVATDPTLGEMALVESREVEAAMVRVGNYLEHHRNTPLAESSRPELGKLAKELRKVCEEQTARRPHGPS